MTPRSIPPIRSPLVAKTIHFALYKLLGGSNSGRAPLSDVRTDFSLSLSLYKATVSRLATRSSVTAGEASLMSFSSKSGMTVTTSVEADLETDCDPRQRNGKTINSRACILLLSEVRVQLNTSITCKRCDA